MECKVVNFSNDDVGVVNLEPSIFSVNRKLCILHDVVRWQLSKKRSGTHKTKGITDVSGTTAKPHSQKRTGRARQGSLRSPQFRGGGVIFGPVVRSHSYSINKKVRKLGLKIALSLKYANGQLVVLDSLGVDFKKTSEISKCVENFNFSSFLVVGNYENELFLATRNLYYVSLMKPEGLNVLDMLRHECVMFTSDALKYIEGKLL